MGNTTAQKGFTLIELLVVIAIIALLLSIVAPALRKAKEHARMVICSTRQRGIVQSLQAYSTDNNGKLPPSTQGRDSNGNGIHGEIQDWWAIPIRIKYYSNRPDSAFGGDILRFLGAYVRDPIYFHCPINPTAPEELGRFYDEYNSEVSTFLNCSYMLLWNYRGFEKSGHSFSPIDGKHQLMISDLCYMDNGVVGPSEHRPLDKWIANHRMQGAYSYGFNQGVDGAEDQFQKFWMKPDSRNNIPRMRLNSGYLDGSVRQSDTHTNVIGLDLFNGNPQNTFLLPIEWR